jgi:predicted acyltransferase
MQTTTNPAGDLTRSRLLSLDALRGFDMLWISGGATLLRVLAQDSPSGFLNTLATQMQHVKWEGFRFYDLIFPLFMFISGVAIPFAIISKLEAGAPKKNMVMKALRRMVILIILGIIYGGIMKNGFSNPRIASVLGQIGIGYFFASLIVIYVRSLKGRIYWLGGILAGIAILQLLVPVPGFGAGVLTPEGCINGFIDRIILPGKLYGGTFDPEGLLCNVSAIGITLMGTIAGHFLRQHEISDKKKLAILSITGVSMIIFALIIIPFYPVIKSCWTTSFNILAGGISFLLLTLFYLVIDVWGWKKWSFFFVVIGMNSIFVYLFNSMVNVRFTASYLLGSIAALLGEKGSQLLLITGTIALTWTVLYIMYRNKIFLRV